MKHATDKASENVIHDKKRIEGLKKHSEEINKIVIESLKQAMLRLLNKKDYQQITITELCQQAGVSRMAFYGNFVSKDELVNSILLDWHHILINKLGNPFTQRKLKKWYQGLFLFIKENVDVLKLIFDAGFRDKYLSFVNELMLKDTRLSQAKKYQRLIWSGAIVNIIVWWISNQLQESPEEIAYYCYKHLVVKTEA